MGVKTDWIEPATGQTKLTVAHLRRAIEGLPDDMPVGPAFTEIPSDAEPAVMLEEFGIQKLNDDASFVFGVRLVPLDEIECDDEDEAEDE